MLLKLNFFFFMNKPQQKEFFFSKKKKKLGRNKKKISLKFLFSSYYKFQRTNPKKN